MTQNITREELIEAAEAHLHYEGNQLALSEALEENPARSMSLKEVAAALETTVEDLRDERDANGTLL